MFILNHHSPLPLYKQLYDQLREQILAGRLPAHTQLPSVRALTAELAVSRNTVEGAYQELYAEGYIYSRPRSGYFVSLLDQDLAARSLTPLPPRRGSVAASTVKVRYDFHPAALAPESFPLALWRKCLLEVLRDHPRELTQYGPPQGDWGLRSLLQSYLESYRGVFCTPEQIVICAGLQQSLEIVAHLLKGRHNSVAIEDPGYHLPRAVFRNNGFTVVPVTVGVSGIDLDELHRSDSTIAYVTPSHQLPMGYVMPVASRLKLIEWADAGGNLIIEDDYDSELRYHGKPIPSLQGLRPEGKIVYTGTFSKIFSPALRVSYMVLPPALVDLYHQLYRDYFSTVSLLEQRTLAKFMEEGHWLRHVRRMRILYQHKHDALLSAIERHFGNRATVIGKGAGLHVVLQLPENCPCEMEIIRRAEGEGIRLFPFSSFSVLSAPSPTKLLLGFGSMAESVIEEGVARLSRICC